MLPVEKKKPMKRRNTLSLILHIVIVLVTVLGCFMRFGGYRPFGPNSSPSNIGALRYFTVLSNLFIGLVSLICVVIDIMRLAKKIKQRPLWVDVMEYVGTAFLALTMVTVLLVLGPGSAIIAGDIAEFFDLYHNHNLFFHLLTPLMAIACYLLNAERVLPYHFIPVAMGPIVIYETFYSIVAFSHMDANGKVSTQYDWYHFMQGGVFLGCVAIIVTAAVAALLCFLLLFFRKKVAILHGFQEKEG